MKHAFKEQRPCLHKGPGQNRENNHPRVGKETLGCGLAIEVLRNGKAERDTASLQVGNMQRFPLTAL